MQPYDRDFYSGQAEGSLRSARIILRELRAVLTFQSACDVGCGAGTRVRALHELGAEEVLGVDGAYARPSLQIPQEWFHAHDLARPLTLPGGPGRRFDLALSLEVAEHLPPERAAAFVADLTRLAPAVLFSAAIPGQGGTDHRNERWQGDWVAEFARHDFLLHDVIRPRIWDRADVETWYRQNTLLFLHRDHPQAPAMPVAAPPVSMVHPAMFPLGYNMDNKGLLLRLLWWSLWRDLRRWRARLVGG